MKKTVTFYENGNNLIKNTKNYVAWVLERTMPTQRPPPLGEVCTNFCADRGCHVVNMTDPNDAILGFLDSNRYFSIK
jgi:hypothetical protein